MLTTSDAVCTVIKDSIYWYWLDLTPIHIPGVCVRSDSASHQCLPAVFTTEVNHCDRDILLNSLILYSVYMWILQYVHYWFTIHHYTSGCIYGTESQWGRVTSCRGHHADDQSPRSSLSVLDHFLIDHKFYCGCLTELSRNRILFYVYICAKFCSLSTDIL